MSIFGKDDIERRYNIARLVMRSVVGLIIIAVVARLSWLSSWVGWVVVVLVATWAWRAIPTPKGKNVPSDASEELYKRVAYNLGRRATSRDQNPWDPLSGSPARWRYSDCWIAGYSDKQWRPDEWQYSPMSRTRLLWWRLKLWAFGPRGE